MPAGGAVGPCTTGNAKQLLERLLCGICLGKSVTKLYLRTAHDCRRSARRGSQVSVSTSLPLQGDGGFHGACAALSERRQRTVVWDRVSKSSRKPLTLCVERALPLPTPTRQHYIAPNLLAGSSG